jgi:hypothetical protein
MLLYHAFQTYWRIKQNKRLLNNCRLIRKSLVPFSSTLQLGVEYFQNNIELETTVLYFCACPSSNRSTVEIYGGKLRKSKAIGINVGIKFARKCLTRLAVGPVRSVFRKSWRLELRPLGLQYICSHWANCLTLPVLIPNTYETRKIKHSPLKTIRKQNVHSLNGCNRRQRWVKR